MTNHLTKRDNVYYFRRKIPVDLQEHFKSTQRMFSLKTRDYAEAKRLAATHTVLTDAEFAVARRAKTSVKTDNWAEQAAAMPREEAYPEEGEAEWQRGYEANPEYFDGLARARHETSASADAVLNACGLPTAAQLEVFQTFGGFHPDDLPTREQAARVTGRVVVSTGDAVPHKVAPATQVTAKFLRDVVPSWKARNAPKEDAIGRTEKAIDLFEQAVGRISLCELTKAHGATFVRFLLDSKARRFGRKTAANHASSITALLNVAVKDDLIDRNLLDLTFDKTIGAETREPWTDSELELMYGHALFSDRMGDVPEWQRVKPADGRALLLLLQHTGARIGEIAQLRRGDFQVRDGITAIRITAEAGTVKTKESERTVPLAGHLLADPWFSAWLAGVLDGTRTDAAAFPSMAGRVNGPSDTAVRWFMKFRAVVGLPPGKLNGAHRFRHWIRSALASNDVGDATADAITGHAAQGSSGRVDYTKIQLPVMLAALNRLTFPKIFGGNGA